MQIVIPISSAVTGKVSEFQADVPDSVTNEGGRVTVVKGYARVEVMVLDAGFRAAGITSIRDVSQRIAHTATGAAYVNATTNMGDRGLVLATRPWLRELVENAGAINDAINLLREEHWRAERQAVDDPLLAKMRADAAALRELIPAGAILVSIRQTGDADGHPILEYMADGVALTWSDVNIVGVAAAVRPGALGAFAEERVGYVLPDVLAARRAANQATSEATAAARAELFTTPIPGGALAAYRRWNGDADRAWENDDEYGSVAITHWRPFIEAQGLMTAGALASKLRDAAREDVVDDDGDRLRP